MSPFRYRRTNPVVIRTPGPRVLPQRTSSTTTTLQVIPRLSRLGYGWPYAIYAPFPLYFNAPCPTPIAYGRLAITVDWAVDCFWPAYVQARGIWGPNAAAVATEVLLTVLPSASLRIPTTGAEHELRRRLDLAVAVLLGADGIPTRFPGNPPSPRPPLASQIAVPWIRALVTGWI